MNQLQEFDDIEMESAQRIYVPFTHRLRTGYDDLLIESFQSSGAVKTTDFSDYKSSAQKMNSWMKQQTNGKIDSIVSEGFYFLYCQLLF